MERHRVLIGGGRTHGGIAGLKALSLRDLSAVGELADILGSMNSSSGSGTLGDSGLNALVEDRKSDIEAVAARYRISNVRIFGSVARGDSHDLSDIDFLVDLPQDASLFDLSRFRRELSALLGVDVDVVSSRALLSRDREILEQAVSL